MEKEEEGVVLLQRIQGGGGGLALSVSIQSNNGNPGKPVHIRGVKKAKFVTT